MCSKPKCASEPRRTSLRLRAEKRPSSSSSTRARLSRFEAWPHLAQTFQPRHYVTCPRCPFLTSVNCAELRSRAGPWGRCRAVPLPWIIAAPLEMVEHQSDERLQFSLLKMFLWTGVVAALLGVSRTLGVGMAITGYMISWFVVYGVTRMTIARKTAIAVSLALGVIGVTAVTGPFIRDTFETRSPSFLSSLLSGCVLGPIVGLLVAALLETLLRSLDAVDRARRALSDKKIDQKW